MADLGSNKKRIAQLFRMLGSSGGERKNAFAALERIMQGGGITWTDIGDVIEHGDEDKYTEAEMQEFALAARAKGIEDGIKIGMTRAANNGNSNGHFVLPEHSEMADYCRKHRDDLEPKHHSFVDKMPARVRSRRPLSPKEKGYLASLYIQLGGRSG